MPKAPVLSRQCFFDVLNDGTFYDLDWNLVNSTVGTCMEMRSMSIGGLTKIAQVDVVDSSFNSRVQLDEDAMFRLMGSGGRLRPLDFTY